MSRSIWGIVFKIICSIVCVVFVSKEFTTSFGEAVVVGFFLYSVFSYYFMFIRWNREEKMEEDIKYGGHWEPTSCFGFIIEYLLAPIFVFGLVSSGVMWLVSKILPESMLESAEMILGGIVILIPIISDIRFIVQSFNKIAEEDITNNL